VHGGKNSIVSARISGIFFCSTLLIIGSIVLLNQMSLDYNSVLYASQFSITAALIAGILGFYIGKVLDTAKCSSRKKHKGKKHSPKAGRSDFQTDDTENDKE